MLKIFASFDAQYRILSILKEIDNKNPHLQIGMNVEFGLTENIESYIKIASSSDKNISIRDFIKKIAEKAPIEILEQNQNNMMRMSNGFFWINFTDIMNNDVVMHYLITSYFDFDTNQFMYTVFSTDSSHDNLLRLKMVENLKLKQKKKHN